MSKNILKWLTVVAAVLVTAPLAAQVPSPTATPEGTVITNNVSVSFTDANGNAYAPATASVNVTVGFVAFIDVTGQATVTPSSPSTGNNLVFTINNNGNGIDTASVTTTAGTGVTITGYIFNGNPYANLTLLNAAIRAVGIPRTTGSISVTVVYNVASLYGGQTIPVTLTATSIRSGSVSDTHSTNVSPPVAGGVSVTATSSTANRLPTGTAPAYSTTFTVSNGANASRTFNLSGAASGAAATIGSVNGGTATVTIGANSTATITVTYTVNNVAAGSTSNVTLTATATDDALVTATGTHVVTVIKASLALTKEVFRVNQSTPITASDRVIPGEDIYYKLTITNQGAAAASGLTLTDQLPAEVTYVASSGPGSWAISQSAGTVTATLTGTLAPSASDVIWVRVTVK